MIDDTRLRNKHMAQGFQNAAVRTGELLIWTIYEHPSDYPDLFIARPHATMSGGRALPVHLAAPDLAALRALLPEGLVLTARHPDDDDVIVETWL